MTDPAPDPLDPGEETLWQGRPEGRRGGTEGRFRLRLFPRRTLYWLPALLVGAAIWIDFNGRLEPAGAGAWQRAAWLVLLALVISATAEGLMSRKKRGSGAAAYAVTTRRTLVFGEGGEIIAAMPHADLSEVLETKTAVILRSSSREAPIVMEGLSMPGTPAGLIRERRA